MKSSEPKPNPIQLLESLKLGTAEELTFLLKAKKITIIILMVYKNAFVSTHTICQVTDQSKFGLRWIENIFLQTAAAPLLCHGGDNNYLDTLKHI